MNLTVVVFIGAFLVSFMPFHTLEYISSMALVYISPARYSCSRHPCYSPCSRHPCCILFYLHVISLSEYIYYIFTAMGAKVNLWKAVKVSKNLNGNSIPKNLMLGGVPIAEEAVAQSFARFFMIRLKIM